MKKVLSTFLVLLLILSSLNFIQVVKADETPTMSIKLKNYIGNQNQLTISTKGEYDISDSTISLVEGKSYLVKVEKNALSLYENGTLLASFSSFTAVPKEYGTNNYMIINNRPYLGTMKFVTENINYVRPVNTLPLEDYLKGVVPFEMYSSWNKEALKAQAVAARTYAERYTSKEIDDTINYQAYGGYSWFSNSTAAVEETKSQTLTYNGKLIDAFYSASNGGMTESNVNVWGGTPLAFFPIKEDPYDTKVPWSFTLKKSQIETANLDLANPQNWWNSSQEADTPLVNNIKNWMYQNGYANNEIKITSIPALSFLDKKTSGGRVQSGTINLQFFLKNKTTGLYVMNDNNQIKTNTLSFTNTDKSKIRAMIGINIIKSYLVTNYTDDGTSYSVSGFGNGHGVGMSQWGAKVMADKGLSYRDILNFYYPGTTLTNSDSVPVTDPNNGASVPITNPPMDNGTSGPTTNPPGDNGTSELPSIPIELPKPNGTTLNPKQPIISNVSSSYSSKSKQIAVDYTLYENVTSYVYIKNAKGTILSYPVKNSSQKPGNQHVVVDVSKVPNGVYTFGIIITNNDKITSSAIKNVTITKIISKPKVNVVANKDAAVTGNTEAKATVTVKVGSKVIGHSTADSVGKFKVTIAKQKAGTKLAISAKDIAGNSSSSFALTVKDKIAPSKPRVNTVTYKDSVVTGTTEGKAAMTIKAGTKVIGTGKADSKGKFSVKIPKQKVNKTLSITAKDGASNVSAATVLKIKVRR